MVVCEGHKEPCKKCVVKKEGKNVGRPFWACSKERSSQCDFFKWADVPIVKAGSKSGTGTIVRITSNASNPLPTLRLPPTNPVAVAPTTAVRRSTKEEWMAALTVTSFDVERIKNVEQRTPEWLNARIGRLTASNFGTAAGHNKHQSSKRLVNELLWKSFSGNKATRWGTFFEPVALAAYTAKRIDEIGRKHIDALKDGGQGIAPAQLAFEVSSSGLNVCQAIPWLAFSPDGIVHTTDDSGHPVTALLEIKCPFGGEVYAKCGKYDKPPHPLIPPGIPAQYYDQIQGIMALGGYPWADFCVWTPDEMDIKRYAFDKVYWDTVLYPALHRFYFELYLPAALDKENGKVKEDGDEAESVIELD